ncbi:MAG: class I SAM-dependent methyltransferase [Pseudomonadota bacterium]
MAGFDPSWLALREPYDHGARDRSLTDAFVTALGASPQLVDLGSGTGSNLRFLAPFLQAGQRWTCIDHDPELLACLTKQLPDGLHVETCERDLASDLEAIALQPGMGVTGAALLDLASADWLDRLAIHCRNAALLMTLSFDGRMIWRPVDPDDRALEAAFARHQQRDKGFGPALGPRAGDYLSRRLRDDGRQVHMAPSDWIFGGGDGPILRAMIDGVSAAAEEEDPSLNLDAWRARRVALVEAGQLSLTVGHVDILALP